MPSRNLCVPLKFLSFQFFEITIHFLNYTRISLQRRLDQIVERRVELDTPHRHVDRVERILQHVVGKQLVQFLDHPVRVRMDGIGE